MGMEEVEETTGPATAKSIMPSVSAPPPQKGTGMKGRFKRS
jgi:hypothetical protein